MCSGVACHLTGLRTAGEVQQGTGGRGRFSFGVASASQGSVPLGCVTAGGYPAVSLERPGGDFDLSSSVNSVNTIKIIKFTQMEMRETEKSADNGANRRE